MSEQFGGCSKTNRGFSTGEVPSVYLRELVGAEVKAQLAALGIDTRKVPLESHLALDSGAVRQTQESAQPEPLPPEAKANQSVEGKSNLAEAIDSYLKDVEPTARTQDL